MANKALEDYTQYAKYARHNPEKERRETWNEQVDRVFEMHERQLGDKLDLIREDFEFAKKMVRKKKVLGSQRALQFGGDPILDKNAKIYNCTVSYVDRVDFFKECMYLLLCGCGVGFSVQTHHVAKLPKIVKRDKGEETFVIPDSIEGWADAIGVLMQSYFQDKRKFTMYDYDVDYASFSGKKVNFDYSLIREEGAQISWGGKAPGPRGLKNAIANIEKVLDRCLEDGFKTLRAIDAYDIIMHSSDAVLSGGIRRSATICLFSPDDDAMATAKTGDWFVKNPQRGRSNNSALLIRDETTKEQFAKLMESVKQFGEPGFVWADDKEALYNPCVEIGMRAYDEDGNSGFEFCNLCEINGRKATSEEEFLDMCKAAAVLGTIQATYDEFDYLSAASSKIVKKEALLGVSMTGMMDNPEVTFDPEIQRKGARLILKVNERIAKHLGINKCARATCVKPAGTTSCILGSASGVHPHHAKRYMRRVQANKLEFPVQHFASKNPIAVEESVWSNNNTDLVINFLCEVPDGAKTKNQISGIELLEYVKTTQQNWVEAGTRKDQPVAPWLRHNVSNTINVKEDEWDEVEAYIFRNRKWFAGISLIPAAGDLDYPQAPFVTVLNEKELVHEYGEGTVFASGLVVDGLKAFGDNLWSACDTALGIGEQLEEMVKPLEPLLPHKNGYNEKQWASKLAKYANELSSYHDNLEEYNNNDLKLDWVRRFMQFAERYSEGKLRKCSHMLKHVLVWKQWLDLSRTYVDIDWSAVKEESYDIDVSGLSGEACSGGACETGAIGAAIKEKKDKEKAS
jgi:ribonucleoside-triphosphate reductase (thioredoxin)